MKTSTFYHVYKITKVAALFPTVFITFAEPGNHQSQRCFSIATAAKIRSRSCLSPGSSQASPFEHY